MRVEDGEVFGFLGPNGAGKSTTIKLLMRLIFPTTGTARILGKSIEDVSMHGTIGYLPEQPYFYDYLTASEVLDYFARFHGLTASDRRARVQTMLKKVGLETAKKIQLRKYSKGMLQRVGLAQAILHEPKVVVLDEPMSGLDPLGRREVRDIILELKREGRTVLFLHARSVRCGNAVRPRGRDRWRKIAREWARRANWWTFKRRGWRFCLSWQRRAPNLPLLAKATRTGDRYRVQLPEEELYAAMEELKLARGADFVGGADQANAGRVFHEAGGSRPRAGERR